MMHPHIRAVSERTAAFCAAANLIKSNARPSSVLRWLDKWAFPPGFDHTKVFYSPDKQIHLCITEPYNSTDKALASLRELAAEKGKINAFSFAVAPQGLGLWNPGDCFPLLVCIEGHSNWLSQVALLLPSRTENGNDRLQEHV